MSAEPMSSDGNGRHEDVEGETTAKLPDVVASSVTDVDVGKRRCWNEAFESSSSDSNEGWDEEETETDGTKHKWLCMEAPGGAGGTTTNENGNCGLEVKQIICDAHPGCLKSFSTPHEYEEHYNLRHKHKCSVCKRSLPSYHILELHVLEAHDTLFSLMAERKPMLNCFMESCTEMFWRPKQRKKHCLTTHSFPKSFKFWYLTSAKKRKPNKGNAKNSNQDVEKTNTKKNSKQTSINDNDKNKVDIPPDGASSKSAHDDMQLDVEELPVVTSLDENAEMDIDLTGKTNSKQKAKEYSKEKKNTSQGRKAVPTHFTFGHSAPRTFKQKYSFGINKPAEDNVADVSSNLNGEEMSVDLKDMKDVLPSTSSVN
ncbi:unnamed protein product [Orchesella dallaii]|uniref:C2H2-type domain-containing protein n=1 Tax=Orchesella dallaii TaxID=48710 RepID=A0ABP1Q971_9HEXA